MSVPMPKRLDAFVQMANETAQQMAEATDTPEGWASNTIAFRISREEAVGYGLVEPTPEERAEREARAEQYRIKELVDWEVYDAARSALAAITDPVARAVLDLHSSDDVEFPKCRGCDMEGYECEYPDWPCRTVQAVAAIYGIELPTGMLWRRPCT